MVDPLRITVSIAAPLGASNGICALICPALANSSGAVASPTLTDAPESVIGNGKVAAGASLPARLVPLIATSDPAAAIPLCPLAALVTVSAAAGGFSKP